MAVLPGGTFFMGPSPSEEEDEKVPADWVGIVRQRHEVRIERPFAVSTFLVTRADFRRFAGANAGSRTGCVNYYGGDHWAHEPVWSWNSPSFPQTEADPVVCVNWFDAQAYVKWLSDVTGQKYRLLTEIEWEYAARAGSSTRRYWGDDPTHSRQCGFANAADRSFLRQFPQPDPMARECDDGYVHTSPVGTFEPNAFGLYDMQGNVTQWVEDCYRHDGPKSDTPVGNGADTSCSMRVLRGGSWADPPWGVRAADRYRDLPKTRCMGIGFRVARDL
jgi:formylglycine-generating enzyme required for sulfatase activity